VSKYKKYKIQNTLTGLVEIHWYLNKSLVNSLAKKLNSVKSLALLKSLGKVL
jgi:hypothetical protein